MTVPIEFMRNALRGIKELSYPLNSASTLKKSTQT